ncbi:Y-family DNA polymerase [bacterium]|nr:Y-family DNA polymerase [bacterium]
MKNNPIFALIDCNNFYASCERVFRPELEGKPIAVLSNNDGCVIARSQEVKDLGIPMGTPAFKNEYLFKKHGIHVFSSNYTLYADMSNRVMNTIAEFCPDIEVYSIDESFIDLSSFRNRDLSSYMQELKVKIQQTTGIPVSIGIASTKTLAKIANHIAKKNKQYKGVFNLLTEKDLDRVLVKVPVDDVWGIGRQYSKFLVDNNIFTAYDLKCSNDEWIDKYLTSVGHKTVLELRGKSCLDLDMIIAPKKGIVSSKSFGKPVSSLQELEEAVATYTTTAVKKLRNQHSVASIISVFISTNRFKETPQYNNNASFKFTNPTAYTPDFIEVALKILSRIYRKGFLYKKAGVMITDITSEENVPYDIFNPLYLDTPQKNIMKIVDKINNTLGENTLFYGSLGVKRKWQMRRNMLSPKYTTSWKDIPKVK